MVFFFISFYSCFFPSHSAAFRGRLFFCSKNEICLANPTSSLNNRVIISLPDEHQHIAYRLHSDLSVFLTPVKYNEDAAGRVLPLHMCACSK